MPSSARRSPIPAPIAVDRATVATPAAGRDATTPATARDSTNPATSDGPHMSTTTPAEAAQAPIAPKDAEPATRAANAAVARALPFEHTADFDDAHRGFVAQLPERTIRAPKGPPFWDLCCYDFLEKTEAPPTVNPSLWRMARLNMATGLFKVVDRVYQVRGIDLANLTIVEGDTGLILIDPLTTAPAARAALDLYLAHRPPKPVVAVVYSHSHIDHYGGVRGVISDDDVRERGVKVIAPDGFLEAVGGENVLAGNAMARRAQFQFGGRLPRGERQQVDAGLGKGNARGSIGLIPPTMLIVQPVETHVIDGVEIAFHLAPDTEAPAEMHMFMPAFGVLNMAENACKHLHNVCPLRGAVVRDARMWSHYLSDAIERFGPATEVLIGQHHWPTWGREKVLHFLAQQRDLYKHIHDQTLRRMNHGEVPAEIAEAVTLPPELEREWSARGYYGTVSHNVKAIYQRYLSWYDGNPANLNPLPPVPGGKKYVEYMGGSAAVIARAREDFARGEYRWVAQVMNHVVFAEPGNREAKLLAADAMEQLGYQAESATWRNAYLYGAQELRHGVEQLPPLPILAPDLLAAIPTGTLLDFTAVRLNPEKVGGRAFVLNWHVTDRDERFAIRLAHSTLTHVAGKKEPGAQASLAGPRDVLLALILKRTTVPQAIQAGALACDGDAGCAEALFGMLDDFHLMFDVVTP
jgi:alkyl sulfatase BDS1-like metallo-beta-lactamase superfamily hydrolase